jgi:transposase
MFTFPSSVEVYIAVEAMDMRRSFDRLALATKEIIGKDPLSGHLFVFFSKGHDRVKVLFWDRSGFVLYYKRLERGQFHFPRYISKDTRVLRVNISDFALILDGLDLYGAVREDRYQLPSLQQAVLT